MHWVDDIKNVLGIGLAVAAFAVTILVLRLTRPKPDPAPTGPAGFMHLVPGKTYRVIRPFTDFDGLVHPEGETFVFQGYNFLPYEDGLTLIGDPKSLRLQWRPETQGEIINDLALYIAEADAAPAPKPG